VQKFGLQTNRSTRYGAIELEIAKEQASALGRAGRKLRLSLEKYETERHKNLNDEQEGELINEISTNVWALLLQREFIGFTDGNIDWVRGNYRIPEAAINSLGKV